MRIVVLLVGVAVLGAAGAFGLHVFHGAERSIELTKANMESLDIELVYADVNTVSEKYSGIVSLFKRIRDSLCNAGDELLCPAGSIKFYPASDSAAVVFEFYIDCECSLKSSMDVLYISVDLSLSSPSIKDGLYRHGVFRSGQPII